MRLLFGRHAFSTRPAARVPLRRPRITLVTPASRSLATNVKHASSGNTPTPNISVTSTLRLPKATDATLGVSPSVPEFKKTFNKLLVANRGEIACRIIKTARKMGIRTVAVYSDLDANALHVQLADEAVRIGPGEPLQSYLCIDALVDAALSTQCDAVHPGYGFLSENPLFVQALDKAGVRFVGPSAWAIAAMGDKIQSKKLARASGVHVIPGYDGEIRSIDEARTAVEAIGYPVMIKASAGGGGKGMRIAWNDRELREGFVLAKQESKSSFGDDRVLVEKYIDQPRHIEIQVLGDQHGHVVYLPERECSIQRRNQKVIEESPSVHLDDATRQAMGQQAVALAKHVGYSSAGTVEFLVDKNRQFYFLEMNTRLQVEHPITEYVTGLDLVEQMLYAAAGYPLALEQHEIRMKGWAIEARVYAEDPTTYLPCVGRLKTYQEPSSSVSAGTVRCDSGFMEGSSIHVEYDPLICKLACHGDTRLAALATMTQALDEYVIDGVTHNIPLLRAVVTHPRFQAGNAISTHFLADAYPQGFRPDALADPERHRLAATLAAMWIKREATRYSPSHIKLDTTLWIKLSSEQHGQVSDTKIDIQQIDASHFKATSPHFSGSFCLDWPLDSLLTKMTLPDASSLVVQYLDVLDAGFQIQYQGNTYKAAILNELQHDLSKHLKTRGVEQRNKWLRSPMPGRIVSVAIKEDDEVQQGEELLVVEAMKMQNILRTSHAGKIKKIMVDVGHSVKSGQVLVEYADEA
ncbi:carbamoyl-phosphate synthase L chain, ATP binding domain-containing protein [Gongronella butleri]|nr:carbamoyl-phosphate synthase L chain, ATP binding domain-containing protein [Gongronella butleri]